jgi:hypothetical protein
MGSAKRRPGLVRIVSGVLPRRHPWRGTLERNMSLPLLSPRLSSWTHQGRWASGAVEALSADGLALCIPLPATNGLDDPLQPCMHAGMIRRGSSHQGHEARAPQPCPEVRMRGKPYVVLWGSGGQGGFHTLNMMH